MNKNVIVLIVGYAAGTRTQLSGCARVIHSDTASLFTGGDTSSAEPWELIS